VVKLRKRVTGSNLGDTGRVAAHDRPRWAVDSVTGLRCRWGGHQEGLRRTGGDVAGAELDAKLIEWFAANTGTIPRRSCCPKAVRMGGIDASSVEGAEWGGGPGVCAGRARGVYMAKRASKSAVVVREDQETRW
jgi:hypothetical protein